MGLLTRGFGQKDHLIVTRGFGPYRITPQIRLFINYARPSTRPMFEMYVDYEEEVIE